MRNCALSLKNARILSMVVDRNLPVQYLDVDVNMMGMQTWSGMNAKVIFDVVLYIR